MATTNDTEKPDPHLTADAESLPDRRRFDLDAAGFEAFVSALDAPERALRRLSRLLQEPSVCQSTE